MELLLFTWIFADTYAKVNVVLEDIRRRIELIQDFSMPGLSTSVKMSPDNKFILATGIYKPRVRCYEVNNLSLKFERCFDSEVVTFQVLSEDYSKVGERLDEGYF